MTGETEKGRSISVVRKAFALELEFGDRPGGGHAEYQVAGHGDGRDGQRQADRRERVGLVQREQEFSRPLAERLDEHDDQRQDQHQRQEQQGHGDQDRLGRGRFGRRALECRVAHRL